jgi:antitoxin ChpS
MDAGTRSSAMQFMKLASRQFEIARFMLFGSRARGDYRPDSDADIAVFLKASEGDFVGTKLALADLAFDVLLETGIRIQPLPIWESEWHHPENYSNPRLLQQIARDGVPL